MLEEVIKTCDSWLTCEVDSFIVSVHFFHSFTCKSFPHQKISLYFTLSMRHKTNNSYGVLYFLGTVSTTAHLILKCLSSPQERLLFPGTMSCNVSFAFLSSCLCLPGPCECLPGQLFMRLFYLGLLQSPQQRLQELQTPCQSLRELNTPLSSFT